jgi:hypothetical protein
MALARCEKHTPNGRGHSVYRTFALPLGYPETAAICGQRGCERPARIWLNEAERAAFQRGVRIFEIPTHAAKLRIADEIQPVERAKSPGRPAPDAHA